jgi:hypothetical protein
MVTTVASALGAAPNGATAANAVRFVGDVGAGVLLHTLLGGRDALEIAKAVAVCVLDTVRARCRAPLLRIAMRVRMNSFEASSLILVCGILAGLAHVFFQPVSHPVDLSFDLVCRFVCNSRWSGELKKAK